MNTKAINGKCSYYYTHEWDKILNVIDKHLGLLDEDKLDQFMKVVWHEVNQVVEFVYSSDSGQTETWEDCLAFYRENPEDYDTDEIKNEADFREYMEDDWSIEFNVEDNEMRQYEFFHDIFTLLGFDDLVEEIDDLM